MKTLVPGAFLKVTQILIKVFYSEICFLEKCASFESIIITFIKVLLLPMGPLELKIKN